MSPNILENVVIFSLEGIRLTTGRKTLKGKDIKVINTGDIVLPPETIASLGTKKVIDPAKINKMRTFRTGADAICSKYGVPFLNGYAVPTSLASHVRQQLNDLKDQFYIFKNEFLSAISTDFLSWLDKEDETVKKLFESEVIDVKRLDEKLQFGFSSFNISPFGEGESEEKVQSLKESVLLDVVDRISELRERGSYNASNISQTTLNTLREVASKLKGLAVLNPDAGSLSDYLSNFISTLPSVGRLSNDESIAVTTLFITLSDIKTLKQLINSTNLNDVSDVELTVLPQTTNNIDLSTAIPTSVPVTGNTDSDFIEIIVDEDDDAEPTENDLNIVNVAENSQTVTVPNVSQDVVENTTPTPTPIDVQSEPEVVSSDLPVNSSFSVEDENQDVPFFY
ncbi:DUF3150 domain-containing protein [Providencia rettgeri]|uniref:DUF3150 domain-containing protein n=1 Tax=Providencia rettgeri TaxID=587 RepID=A0AAP2JZ72_PRORE|nr:MULTISPECIES: DUF3150 domain-containing protein [Morganellaceae]EJD6040545.1 DUF3150 domain-containing protein [Morganella morganii]EMB4674575.1 DUF3150 domain-containing protein [Proteus mirabilis]APC11368.1 hypothetical protein RB151_016880 [Providencia rettgeri]ARV75796.1 hypothetical protein PRE36_0000004452 [Providencia rettgeri]EJD6040868.1 DUF3150 domain-containing protein [Morganella morganii]